MSNVKPTVAALKKELGPNAFATIDLYTTRDADHGPAIIHHLAQHPEELKTIARLPPVLQLAALGKLDAVVGRSASSSRRSGSRGVTENA